MKKGRFETEAQQKQTFDKIDASKESQISLKEMVQYRINKKFNLSAISAKSGSQEVVQEKTKTAAKLLADFSNQLVEG